MRTLKRGTSLYATTTPGEYFLGTHSRAIRIYTSEQKIIAEHLMRGSNEIEIAAVSGVSTIAIHNVMTELAHQSLLDTSQGSIILSDRFISKVDKRASKNCKPDRDGAYIQLQNRIAPELEQSRWIDGVKDGGVEVLSARQNILVEISGNSRVATLLYSLLLNSGVTQVRFTPHGRVKAPAIGDLDIGVDGITSAVYGFSFVENRESKRRDYSLFPLDKSANYLDEASTPELVVACGDIDPENLSRWMSVGQPFLYIPQPHGGQAAVGPLVIPGKTPCIRCAELSARDQSGIVFTSPLIGSDSNDYPHVAAHAVAAIAASQILSFIDSSRYGDVCGKVITCDYQSLAQPQVVAISRHPLCGCAF
jgi:hypothetical protein